MEDWPSASCGGTPSLKSPVQSTKSHHSSLPSRSEGARRDSNHPRTSRAPGRNRRRKSFSPRYHQRSRIMPIQRRENGGVYCGKDGGEGARGGAFGGGG